MEKLSVPENICLRTEFWRGFGVPELVKSLLLTGVVLAIMIAYGILHQGEGDVIVITVTVVFALAFCMGFFGRVSGTNQSVYDFIKKQIVFQKEQQIFSYKRIEEAYHVAEE